MQRLRLASLPELPSSQRHRLIDKYWTIPTRRLSYTEVIICVVVGITVGYMFSFRDLPTSLGTTAVGLTLPLTLWFFDMVAKRELLATKTFYTDFPVHGIASLDDNLFAISGGGGGLSYGIPDQCVIASVQVRQKEVSQLGQHVINNSAYDRAGKELLQTLDLSILQSLTPYSFWGLAASTRYLCGGVAGVVHIYQLADPQELGDGLKPRTHALVGDQKRRTLVPLGVHKLVDQPFLAKKKVFLRCSVVWEDKICVATEDHQLAYYTILNGLLCFVAIASCPKEITGIHFGPGGTSLLVLTSDKSIIQYPTPTLDFQQCLDTTASFRGLTNVSLRDNGDTPTVMINAGARTWTPTDEVALGKCHNLRPRHLVIIDDPEVPRIAIIGTAESTSARSHAALIYRTLDCQIKDLRIAERWSYKLLKNIGGCPAVADSARYLAVAGNTSFVVLDKKSMAIKRVFMRHDLKSDGSNTLPVTAAAISAKENYLLIGSADYSVVVAPLLETGRSWLGRSDMIVDYLGAVTRVGMLTLLVAFFVA